MEQKLHGMEVRSIQQCCFVGSLLTGDPTQANKLLTLAQEKSINRKEAIHELNECSRAYSSGPKNGPSGWKTCGKYLLKILGLLGQAIQAYELLKGVSKALVCQGIIAGVISVVQAVTLIDIWDKIKMAKNVFEESRKNIPLIMANIEKMEKLVVQIEASMDTFLKQLEEDNFSEIDQVKQINWLQKKVNELAAPYKETFKMIQTMKFDINGSITSLEDAVDLHKGLRKVYICSMAFNVCATIGCIANPALGIATTAVRCGLFGILATINAGMLFYHDRAVDMSKELLGELREALKQLEQLGESLANCKLDIDQLNVWMKEHNPSG